MSALTCGFSLWQIRLIVYRVDDNSVRATTIIRVIVTRNANDPRFLHGDISLTVSEDQPLGVAFLRVNASDADSVSSACGLCAQPPCV